MHAKVKDMRREKICAKSFEKYHFELLPFGMQLSEVL